MDYRGNVRYKHIFVYPVDDKYSIYLSKIFETENYDDIMEIKKKIHDKGDDIIDEVKEKMKFHEKDGYKLKY